MSLTYRAKPVRNRRAALSLIRQDPVSVRDKIVSALNNSDYRLYTLTDIARATKLSPAVVLRALMHDKTLATIVKIHPMRSREGKILFTTKDRFDEEAPFKEMFVDFFATRRPEVADAK